MVALTIALSLASEVEMPARGVLTFPTHGAPVPIAVDPVAMSPEGRAVAGDLRRRVGSLVADFDPELLIQAGSTRFRYLGSAQCTSLAASVGGPAAARALCIEANLVGVGPVVVRVTPESTLAYSWGPAVADWGSALAARIHELEPLLIAGDGLRPLCSLPGGADAERCAELRRSLDRGAAIVTRDLPRGAL